MKYLGTLLFVVSAMPFLLIYGPLDWPMFWTLEASVVLAYLGGRLSE